ncbi:hypothetical protein PFISCL1PPCAC_12615 [Pristionchus fissidentatus]|uniref:ABC transmembrane type-1 domain-containing protein n=1 Tax=Pristionchus fissidentatus TaxID=1538716 RepID=A0AAV5VPE0_9BILA|nr:hypothetical protein PFISCL1PPCAC_12615 [Pristionchus fissidentatus]
MGFQIRRQWVNFTQEALSEASVGRTTIMIAHRLSTLRNADLIYVMENGVVVEQCSHDDLILAGGLYWRIARKQSLGDDDDRKTAEGEDKKLRRTLDRHPELQCKHKSTWNEINKTASSSAARSSLFRIYTHSNLRHMLPSVIFSILRGMQIPFYIALLRLLYVSLKSDSSEYRALLTAYCAYSILLGVVIWIAATGAYYYAGLCSEGAMVFIRQRVLGKILHMNAEYFDQPESSRAKIVNDINQHSGALIAAPDHRLVFFVCFSSSFFACLGASIVLVVLLFGLFILMTNLMEREARESRTAELALEMFENTRTIQIMAVEGYFERKYECSQQDAMPLRNKIVVVQLLIYAFTQSTSFIFGLIAFAGGARFVFQGELSPIAHYIGQSGIERRVCS